MYVHGAVIKISHIDMWVDGKSVGWVVAKAITKKWDDINNSDVQFSVSTPDPRDKYKHSDVMKYEMVQLSYLWLVITLCCSSELRIWIKELF